MIDFSKEIKKKNDNDDEELIRKLHEAESNISSSDEKSLEMEKE